jgi:cyclophilin family peptidyl-prolyl cis-trans isomerase
MNRLPAAALALLFSTVILAADPAPADAPAPAAQSSPAAQTAPTAQPETEAPAHTRVRIVTSMGTMIADLEDARAPLTVANFLRYVREGHYEGTIFQRVIANFVVQGGAYQPDFKKRPAHATIPNESGNGLRNTRGTIGMARADSPHSAAAQFFFNLADNPDLDPLPTRWGYTVFGHVVQGLDVLDRIGNLPTGAGGELKEDVPLKPVIIQKIEIISSPSP